MSDPRIDRIAARWSAAQTVARVTVDGLLADVRQRPLPDHTVTSTDFAALLVTIALASYTVDKLRELAGLLL